MLLIRLLAIFLVLITNTWLLGSVRSNALGRHKRTMARRADRELSRLAGEPCSVSSVWKSRRQPRSLSPSQHRPPAVLPRTHTRHRELDREHSAPVLCAPGCKFDTGGQEKGGRGDADDAAVHGREARFATQQSGMSLLRDAGRMVSSLRRSRSRRFSRSLYATLPYEEDGKSSWDKEVFPEEDGDQLFSAGTLQDSGSDEYYSGEVVDPPATGPVGSAPVPKVPASRMSALYFSGRLEQLRMRPDARLELPRDKFSLHVWVKPEGGQGNPAVIAGE